MKYLLKTGIILFLFSIIFTSCIKEKKTIVVEKPQNYLSYDGKVYEMSQCYFYNVPDTVVNSNQDSVYYWGVILFSPGITVTIGNSGAIETMSGTGSGISLNLVSSKFPNSFVPGNYVIENSPSMIDMPETISSSTGFFDYDIDADVGAVMDFINGEVTVSGAGSVIELKLLIEDENGNVLKGYYKGGFEHIIPNFNKKSMLLEKNNILKVLK